MNDLHHESCWELVSTWSSAAWCIVALQHRDELTRLVLQEQPVKTFVKIGKIGRGYLISARWSSLLSPGWSPSPPSWQCWSQTCLQCHLLLLAPDQQTDHNMTFDMWWINDDDHNIPLKPKSAKCKFNQLLKLAQFTVWCYRADEIQPCTVHSPPRFWSITFKAVPAARAGPLSMMVE